MQTTNDKYPQASQGDRGPVRCAIYTRKSTDHGLDQEFNSLDAQREAAENYINVHRNEGWVALPTEYDDGGFSGGNTDRPALQRLMDDVEDGKIDVVVVYKVDRFARSIGDFAKMMELLKQHGVAFVSVTQHFNTGDSMGTLTLNILMTFAQFEREMTAERIRDKIALSKKKGKFTGGRVPTGYVVDDHKLMIDQQEADGIRMLFQEYANTGSLAEACRRTNSAGHRTKKVVFKTDGRVSGGGPFVPKNAWHILRNRIYLGEIPHKGSWYPGEHEAIISDELWEQVAARHQKERDKQQRGQKLSTGSFLRGLVYDSDGVPLVAKTTYKKKKGSSRTRKYRYFVSNRVDGEGYSAARLPPLPARELEEIVLTSLGEMLQAPEYSAQVEHLLKESSGEQIESGQVFGTLKDIGTVWSLLFPEEQRRLFHLLVDRVTLGAEELTIRYKATGLVSVVAEVEAANQNNDQNKEQASKEAPCP